jgi:NADH-quinone oxidoreductase subunit M
MLKMYQVMLEKRIQKFKDVTFKGLLWLHCSFLFFFWDVSKPITDLITPSLENILTHIN